MVAPLEVYEDVAELLASMDPAKVVALKSTPAQQQRLEYLLEKNQEREGLSALENTELDRILMVNRVVTLAKIRAKRLLFNETKNPLGA